MTFLALPWFVLVTTGSATKMGIVLAVEILPVALLGIPSGALIARLGARTTMVIGDAARAPLMLAIPLLHEAGALTFPLLLVLVFAIGCFLAPYFSAQRLILPELVGDDERTVGQANAIVEGTQRAMALLGPSFAGILIATIGAANVLYVDAATFLISSSSDASSRARPPVAESRGCPRPPRRHPLPAPRPTARVLAVTAAVPEPVRPDAVAVAPVLAFEEFDESATRRRPLLRLFRRGFALGGDPRASSSCPGTTRSGSPRSRWSR